MNCWRIDTSASKRAGDFVCPGFRSFIIVVVIVEPLMRCHLVEDEARARRAG